MTNSNSKDNTNVIIEIKYKKNVKDALKQIYDNKYYDIFKDSENSYLFLGINFDNNLKIEMD